MIKRIWGLLAVLAVLSGCGLNTNPLGPSTTAATSSANRGPLVIATTAEHEPTLLAHVYAEALRAKGFDASVRGYDSRQQYLAAMTNNRVQLAPEYTAELLLAFDQSGPTGDPKATIDALPKAIDPTMVVLDPAPAGSSVVYVVSPQTAEKQSFTSLDQLTGWAKTAKAAVPPDLTVAPFGVPGLAGVYGISFAAVAGDPDPAKRLADLKAGRIGLTAFRSTEPVMDSVVRLDDPQQLTPGKQVIIPLARRELPAEARQVINAIQTKLDDKRLLALTAATGDPAQAARAWLADNGLG